MPSARGVASKIDDAQIMTSQMCSRMNQRDKESFVVRLYSLPEVAVRIQDVLGERPSDFAMYHAGSGRPVRAGSRSLVAGMPAASNLGGSRSWPVDHIEAWLGAHPILQLRAARDHLATDLRAAGQDWSAQARAVEDAKAQGCSWAEIAQVIEQVTGRRISRQAVAARYT